MRLALPSLAGFLIAGLAACSGPETGPATVAVAANFAEPMRRLARDFESTTPHRIEVVVGSTGQLYAQILNGAPIDLFLAADSARPAMLAGTDLAVPGSLFTYAIGRLALWSRESGRIDDHSLERLAEADFEWLAIANPDLAPYGAAARDVLMRVGAWDLLQDRIVRGQNIGQTFALVESGNADLGFVALSQALTYEGGGSWAAVPEEYHAPVRQDAIVLGRGRSKASVAAFVEYLRSDRAREVIGRFGYRS